jgi:hypothetical protein
MADGQDLTDFVVDHARATEHLTALVMLLVKKGIITGPEYAEALQTVVSSRMLDEAHPDGGGTNPLNTA